VDADDQPEKELGRRLVRCSRAAARHPNGFVRVRAGHRWIRWKHRVRVVAALLHAAVPQVSHHVAVRPDWRERERQPEEKGEQHRQSKGLPIAAVLVPDPRDHHHVRERERDEKTKEQWRAERSAADDEKQHREQSRGS
jgi:hypothetical protein